VYKKSFNMADQVIIDEEYLSGLIGDLKNNQKINPNNDDDDLGLGLFFELSAKIYNKVFNKIFTLKKKNNNNNNNKLGDEIDELDEKFKDVDSKYKTTWQVLKTQKAANPDPEYIKNVFNVDNEEEKKIYTIILSRENGLKRLKQSLFGYTINNDNKLFIFESKMMNVYNDKNTKKFIFLQLFTEAIASLLFFIVEDIMVFFSSAYYPSLLMEIGIIDKVYNKKFKECKDKIEFKYVNSNEINFLDKIKLLWNKFYIKKQYKTLNTSTSFNFSDYTSIYINFDKFKDFDYIFSRELSRSECYLMGYIIDNLINKDMIEFPTGFPPIQIVNDSFKRIYK